MVIFKIRVSLNNKNKFILMRISLKEVGLRVVVWIILYLFEHTGEDFQSEVLLVT
jgi:hypothetical protein